MKRFYLYSLLTSLLLLCSTVATAHDFQVGGIFYNITDATAKTVGVTHKGDYDTYYLNAYSGNVVIPSSVSYNGNTYSVTSIEDAFTFCTGLTSITIPNSVTSIGDKAFYECTSLASITIPNSVTSIGSNAFYYCISLTSIEISNSVTSIGEGAFGYCTGLTSIEIPNSVTSIEDDAFGDCTSLKNLYIEDGEGTLSLGYNYNSHIGIDTGEGLFADCPLETLYLGRNLSYRTEFYYDSSYSPTSPFYNIKTLESVRIGNSVTNIGMYAFSGCSILTNIDIPSSVTTIGYDAFYNTAWYNNRRNGIVYAGKVLYSYKGTMSAETSISVKEGTLGIADGAFSYCTGLTSITIPNSVKSIGSSAFYECTGLTSITIPNSVTSIGSGAFYACSGLTSIEIPNSVTSIGIYAFNGCTGLKEVHISDLAAWCNIDFGSDVSNPLYYAENLYLNGGKVTNLVIPDGVTEIKNYAFNWFKSLTSITIPNSVTSIGYCAFSACSSLKEVHISDLAAWCNIDFGSDVSNPLYYAENLYLNGGKVTNLVIPDGVTEIKNYAFNWFKSLTSITIPNSVTSIEDAAFNGCHGLTSIEIPNSVTSIGSYAFNGCHGLTSITIPNSVTSIEDNAFYNCAGLKEVINYSNLTFTKGSTDYGYVAFYADKVVNAQSSIEGDFVFEIKYGVNTLTCYFGSATQITLPDSYKGESYMIGSYAFAGCTGLTSITIPSGVTSIKYGAFNGCTSLKELRIEDGEGTLSLEYNSYNSSGTGKGLFADCPLETLYLGRNLSYNTGRSYGYSPFYKITTLKSVTIDNSVTSIGNYAFYGCDNLKKLELNCAKIEAWFGGDNYNSLPIEELIIGDNTTEIGERAFCNMASLAKITIGKNVKVIRNEVFNGCNAIETIYAMGERPALVGESNFTMDQYLNVKLYVPAGSLHKYEISDVWENFWEIEEYSIVAGDANGDVDGDGSVDVADATTLVSMILDNSLATDAADVDGDGTVDVADVTSLVSIILGTRTANDAPAKAAATRAGEVATSTVSADGDGETLLININNPGYPFSAIQFDLELPEGIEVDFDGEYYAVDLGSRTNSRKHSYPECAIQPDGSLRVVIISMSNALYNGTEGDVATAALKVNGAADGDYRFTIKNVVLSAPGSKEKLAPYTGWINVTGGVTGISDIKEERAESNDIYDLQGRKVTEPVNGGIYIQNGKKVIW